MKNNKNIPQLPKVALAASALLAVLTSITPSARAGTITWDGDTSTDWATGANWVDGIAPANDLTTDIANFNLGTYGGNPVYAPTAPGAQKINGITIGGSNGAMILTTSTSFTSRLQIGDGGITVAAGAGALTLGTTTSQGVLLGANQTWSNNSSSLVSVTSLANNGVGTKTLTLSGTGTGGYSFTNVIGNGSSPGITAIVVDYTTGTVQLKGGNTFSGGLGIKGGQVILGQTGALGVGTVTMGYGGGSNAVSIMNNASSKTYAAPIFLESTHTGTATIGTTLGSATFTGGVTGTHDLIVDVIGTANSHVVTFSTAGLNYTGNLTKNGARTLQLSAANTFGGVALVNAGTLRLDHVNALQNATLDTGTSGAQSVTFNIAGNNTYNIGGLQGADALAISANTISVGSNNASTTFSEAISGTGGNLTKVGSGTLTLSGANTYTGATTVSEGTLLIDGSTAAASAVTVASGAVFGGNGTVNGNLTLDNGAFFAFDTASTLDLVGSLTLNSSFGVASLRDLNGGAINWGSIGDGTYTLIQGGNLGSGFFSASNITNFGDANAYNIGGGRSAYFDNGSLALVVIPEPGTLALMGITGLALLAGLRRRK